MDKKQIIVSIVVIIFSLVLGMCLGIFLQSHNKSQLSKTQAVNSLSSKTISSITAYGKVTNIRGKVITISNFNDSLVVPMADNARIYSFTIVGATDKTAGTPVQQASSLENIKVDDNVNIVFKLLQTGQMQGQSLVILPETK